MKQGGGGCFRICGGLISYLISLRLTPWFTHLLSNKGALRTVLPHAVVELVKFDNTSVESNLQGS